MDRLKRAAATQFWVTSAKLCEDQRETCLAEDSAVGHQRETSGGMVRHLRPDHRVPGGGQIATEARNNGEEARPWVFGDTHMFGWFYIILTR